MFADIGQKLFILHGLLLPGLELLQLGQPLELLFLDLAGGDLRPHLDDTGDVLHGQLGRALGAENVQLVSDADLLTAKLRDAGVAVVQLLLGELLPLRWPGGHQRLPLERHVLQVALQLHAAVDVGVVEGLVGAGLVAEWTILFMKNLKAPATAKSALTANLPTEGFSPR